jgi:ABC-type multidrug transport system, ATPase component
MSVIEVKNLTKDYGHGRGIFNVSIQVEKGEVYGFLGPNGAGKTTTIRHIMGFQRALQGSTTVLGQDCWRASAEIQKDVGYLPGEIALPEGLTGHEFIKMMADLRGLKDLSYTNYLIDKFQLEPSGKLKRMSLGMKRKLAIVIAFMHDPKVLVLDEPTSGLDPIMQQVFIDFIKEEKRKGKTILLSSHLFEEIDETCDKISIIKDGHLISTFVATDLKNNENKTYKLEFNETLDYDNFKKDIASTQVMEIIQNKEESLQVKVAVNDQDINEFIGLIADYDVKFFSEVKFTLEDYFMQFYDRNIEHEKEIS